ncbi:hypothetical protein LSAT2_029910 [Lamellibrachia satsuma]|nr:hypothetical protein LSAT2_029910 [Lamellibrachia satsuma]
MLKEQWKRMKATAKKEVSDFERAQKKTGGGKAPTPPSGLSELIKALLKHEFETLNNSFDDDFMQTTPEVEAGITSREDDNARETNEIVTRPTTSYDSAETDNIAQEPTNRQVLHTLLKSKRKLWGH